MKLQKIVNKFQHYILNLMIIFGAVLFYRINHYYSNFLRQDTQMTILILASIYTICGFFYYVFIPLEKINDGKGTIIFRALKRISKDTVGYFIFLNTKTKKPFPKIERHEKTAFLFTIVKIFFLPIMLNFFFANYNSFISQLRNIINLSSLNIAFFNNLLFPFLLTAIFLFDTLWFSFGYSIEAGFLKNKIRSVEPTILGWAVALICYPPFNGLLTKYMPWYANDYVIFFNNALTFIIRIIILLLLGIYLSATFALGTRCSNLTNRGIVSRGPYKFIRHPAYIGKNLAWWITIIPVMSVPAFLSMSMWSIVYHLRSITEERHLMKDPDYQLYAKIVKYRYIPGIY